MMQRSTGTPKLSLTQRLRALQCMGVAAITHIAAIPNMWSSNSQMITLINTLFTSAVFEPAEAIRARSFVLYSSESVGAHIVSGGM